MSAILLAFLVGATACGDEDATSTTATSTTATSTTAATTDATLRTVGVQEFHDLIAADASIKVIDVRTPEEFSEGHLAGATNIDFQAADFAERTGQLDREASYAIYCRSGNRSGQALDQMSDDGFTKVTNMDGGINDWTAAGFPVE